jgi:hypothetical protein
MARRAYGWDPFRAAQNLFDAFDTNMRVGGGPVRLSPAPVMQVTADHAALWRGLIYDYYDGHGWQRTSHDYVMLQPAVQAAGSKWWRYDLPTPRRAGITYAGVNHQKIKDLALSALIFGEGEPASLTVSVPGARDDQAWFARFRPKPRLDAYRCLSWIATQVSGHHNYEMTSREPVTDSALLRAALPDYPVERFGDYLSAPAATKLALQTQVDRLTANLDTPYDKVTALKSYLEKRCYYTLDAPATPADADAVDWFVNHSERGACDQFSTALAVMARLAGVPAREATGYATGEYDHKLGCFVVRGTDAHAWTEIYFNGYGWVPFDAQAQRQYDNQSLTDLVTGGQWHWVVSRAIHQALVVGGLALLIVLALAALVDPLQLLRRALHQRPKTALGRLAMEYKALYETLLRRSKLGSPVSDAESLSIRQDLAALRKRLSRRSPRR